MTSVSPLQFDSPPDIKLIACDMDGTLLDENQIIPQEFWALMSQLNERGIIFCPASGRQYYNLLEQFRPVSRDMVFIAENGAYVVRNDKELSSHCLKESVVPELINEVRTLSKSTDVGVVLCGKQSAYIERDDEAFLNQACKYYERLERVDDLLDVRDEFLKVAVYDFASAERVAAPAFARFRSECQVVISGAHWLDVMSQSCNKGAGIQRIQEALNITRDQTMAFGDFLNDMEMMDMAAYSFAMANAHPDLKARARFISPRNGENGVIRTIRTVLAMA